MAKKLGVKAVVVGCGVVGSAVAYRLAEAGADVTIVDRAFPGAGTSGATFSWLNSFNKRPLAYHRLNVMGMSEHRVLAEEIGSQDCLHFDGGMMWEEVGERAHLTAESEVDGRGQSEERGYVDLTTELARGGLAAKIDSCRTNGYFIEEITAAEAQKMEPDLSIDSSKVSVVYVMPGDGWIETRGLAHRLCTAAVRRHGAAMRMGLEVRAVKCRAGATPTVELSDGSTLGADMVINAAGPDAGMLASRSEGVLPIERSLGVSFVSGSAPSQLRHVVHAPGVSLRPDSETRVMMRLESLDSQLVEGQAWTSSDVRCEQVIAGASQVMPNLRHVGIESVRIGIRPIPIDGVSVVGFDPSAAGLYHVVTHSGATLAPILARLVCADLFGSRPPELESFRPDRFVASAPVRGGSSVQSK